MIVINLWLPKGNGSDEYVLHLAGVINDMVDLNFDIDLIKDCISNDMDTIEEEQLYEIYLERATISADPIPELAFTIKSSYKRTTDESGNIVQEPIRL